MLFTVFTPTFNRAHTLHRVRDSLLAQTCRDFEWLIIDDGSTDATRELVEHWRAQRTLPIRYYHQPNRGKHVAYNRAVELAEGELILPLDSDDACIPTALERLKWHWERIPPDAREQFSAVTALCVDPQGQLVGDRFPRDVTDSNTLEMKFRYKVSGEKWGFQRRDVLRQFPFPELEGVSHCPETVVWSAIARKFTTRYINEALRIYYPGTSAEGQLTGAAPARIAKAARFEHRTVLNAQSDWFGQAPMLFASSAVHFVRFSYHAGVKAQEQFRELEAPIARLLWLLAWLPGWFVYRRDQKAR